MYNKKFFSIFALFLGVSAAAFAFGAWDRTRKADSNALPEKEVPNPDVSMPAELDDPLVFMGQLTGHENIIEIHGGFDITKVRELLNLVRSGEADSSDRHYFVYSPEIRTAPVTMTQRRLDAEIAASRAAREISRDVYVVDIEYTIRSRDGKIVQSLQNRAAVELTSDIVFIGRRPEKVITYDVDLGNDNYGYGIYYIFSAIAVESRDSEFNKVIAGFRNNNYDAVNSIILEKIASKNSENSAE